MKTLTLVVQQIKPGEIGIMVESNSPPLRSYMDSTVRQLTQGGYDRRIEETLTGENERTVREYCKIPGDLQ